MEEETAALAAACVAKCDALQMPGWRLVGWLLLIQLVTASPALHADNETTLTEVEVGHRLYTEGILPDGSLLRALRDSDILFEGKRAACVSCHRRSGMGSIEGSGETSVLVPPLVGPLLFRSARFHGHFLDRNHHWVPNEAWARALSRSAYDEKSLGRALREGLDADGKVLQAPMPRYALDDRSVSALRAYLNQLTAEAPGVETEMLHVATVITPDAPVEQAGAVIDVLRAWSAHARGVAKRWSLHVWHLEGEPGSWEEQLHRHYRRQPVFAVLSGAGRAEWSPVHRFCEESHIPCVLPSVEIAPENNGDFYPVYYSPGVTLEARVLANYLAAMPTIPGIVQVFSDSAGRQAALTLRSHLTAGSLAPIDRAYSQANVRTMLAELPRGGAVVLWLRSEEVQKFLATAPEGLGVQHVFLSALLAPPEEVVIPPVWKTNVSWVSLYDDLGVQRQIARLRLQRWLRQQGLPDSGTLRVQADAYTACYLFTSALSEINSEEVRRHRVPLSREHLIEKLENLVNKYSDGSHWINTESHIAHYGRMSLGPGQRIAVRGGSLLRYESPDSRKLVRGSDRIVP